MFSKGAVPFSSRVLLLQATNFAIGFATAGTSSTDVSHPSDSNTIAYSDGGWIYTGADLDDTAYSFVAEDVATRT
jgi:hypothetical protein